MASHNPYPFSSPYARNGSQPAQYTPQQQQRRQYTEPNVSPSSPTSSTMSTGSAAYGYHPQFSSAAASPPTSPTAPAVQAVFAKGPTQLRSIPRKGNLVFTPIIRYPVLLINARPFLVSPSGKSECRPVGIHDRCPFHIRQGVCV
jgi:hypothetical protein